MPECEREEAETRVCLNLRDALEKDAQTVILRTVDTDVIPILVGQFRQLTKDYPHTTIWVVFGTRKNLKNICKSPIFGKLGRKISLAIPEFSSFTGSDTTSQLQGKGKKTAWAA